MPTFFSHPAVALSTITFLKGVRSKFAIVLAGVFLAVLPDADVIGFKYGIPYQHMLGHRGLSHSIIFAFVLSIVFVIFLRQSKVRGNIIVWLYLFICGVSHGLLDALTNGGLGVGFFMPFSEKRYFFEYRQIEVSTLSFTKFFNAQGLEVVQSELLFIWLPAIFIFIAGYILRKKF